MREKHGCPMVEILVEQAQKSLWGVRNADRCACVIECEEAHPGEKRVKGLGA